MARVKKKDHENLTNTAIQKVIDLLNPSEGKPITKKDACGILNISYNTTRLGKIMDDFVERREYVTLRKSQNRGKSATEYEIQEAAYAFLKGEPISKISEGMFRSAGFVKNILEKLGVPSKPVSAEERVGTAMLPDSCVADEFSYGEVAWSAVYHAVVEVREELSLAYLETHKGLGLTNYEEKYGCKVYAIYVKEATENDFGVEGGFSGFSLACDLGSLAHLADHGVKLDRL